MSAKVKSANVVVKYVGPRSSVKIYVSGRKGYAFTDENDHIQIMSNMEHVNAIMGSLHKFSILGVAEEEKPKEEKPVEALAEKNVEKKKGRGGRRKKNEG